MFGKIKTIPSFNITLFRPIKTDNIYYYFRYKNRTYRGSTRTSILRESERISLEKYIEVETHRGGKTKISFQNVVKQFLKYKKPRISKKTFSEYERQSKLLVQKFKNKDITTFKKRDYNNYENWRRDYYSKHPRKRFQRYVVNGERVKGCEYKNVGNTTINREIGLLVSILRFVKNEMGVLEGTTVPSWKKLKEKRREEILTSYEWEELRKYFKRQNPYYWKIISFVYSNGLRYPSEVNRLKWKDIKFQQHFIIIRERKGKPPKDMTVPLVGKSEEILKKLKNRNGISTNPEDFVFVDNRGKRIRNIRKSFRKGLKEVGIDKDVSMYTLRHMYTTNMLLRTDIPLKMISRSLGHTSSRMVDKHYSHLQIQDLVDVFQKSEKEKSKIFENIKKRKLEDIFPIVDVPEG